MTDRTSASSRAGRAWSMLVGWFIVSGARAEQAAAGEVAAQIRQHGGIVLVRAGGRPPGQVVSGGVVSALELSRAMSGLGWRVAPHR